MAVVSGKGGTGKTTIAVNLAVMLASLGENTLLVDGNILSPHVGFHFSDGIYRHTLHDVMNSKIGFSQAVHYDPSGLKIVPGDPLGIIDLSHSHHLKHYKNSADYVLYDAPPGDHSYVLDHADQFLVVTQATIPALMEAKKIITSARAERKVLAGVVLNSIDKGGMDSSQAEMFLGQTFAAKLSHDNKILQALHNQEPFVQSYPKHPFSQEIRQLALRITNRPL